MREIKFRAWDSYEKKMLFADEFPIFFEKDNGFHSGKCADNGNGDWGNLPLMQYTGLKDKNGKEIYEGDIILIENQKTQIQKKKAICTIAMSSRGGYCAIIEKVIKWENFRLDPPAPKTHIYFFNILDTLVYEIIGNIYENPGLIKKEDVKDGNDQG